MQSFLFRQILPLENAIVRHAGYGYISNVKATISVLLLGALLARSQEVTDEQRKARELLRQTIEERQKKNPPPAAVQTNTSLQLTQAEMEQQYLAGKITAKQFQQYLRQQPPAFGSRMSAEKQAQAVDMLRALTGKTNLPPATATKAAPGKADPAPGEPASPAIVDVEGKIRELEKLKEAREKASATNAPAAATVPKTKREKLDALLKQFVDGKLSDAEYKEQRGKIIAGPE